jgi:glycosyltransferase involved in cell wall biosynthesis
MTFLANNMHIAFLTPEFPHPKLKHAAGLGTSIKNLVNALVEKNVKVTVFVYGQDKNDIFFERDIEIHSIADKKYAVGKWFFYRIYIQKYVNKLVKKESIDLIEAPDWTGITAFMKFNIPLIIRFHGSDTYFCHLEQRKQKIKNFWFEKLAVKRAQGFIAPTTFAGDVSAKLFGINPIEVKKIHYGLSLDQFQNENPKAYQNGLILYIGTIIRKKGVFELPSIFSQVRKQFPEAKLVLIGGDSSDIHSGNSSTWQLVQDEFQQEDRPFVQYLGKIPYQEVKEYIEKAHVCVFPTFAETLGMVTIESMAMQKAVVNSNIGWAQELMIDGVSGYLVNPTNHKKYAANILNLLFDQEKSQKMGIEARKHVETFFDINTIRDENIAFYQTFIAKK